MSADNWATCPRCSDFRENTIAKREQLVAEQYGKVSVEAFDALRADLRVFVGERVMSTFREDYEFYGAEEGTVMYSYSGSCSDCGLKVSFGGQHPFYPQKEQ